jgi:hypothetical protein
VAAPGQRRALGALFLVLAFAIAGIAYAATKAHRWVIGAAALALALWLLGLAVQSLRVRRGENAR